MGLFGAPAAPSGELPGLPTWAVALKKRLKQGGVTTFILHGPGVRDIHPLGTRRYGGIR